MKWHCVRAVTIGKIPHAITATKNLQTNLGVSVSERTVRRALNEAGLDAGEKVERPMLSAKNVKARLEFAKRHKDWTVAD